MRAECSYLCRRPARLLLNGRAYASLPPDVGCAACDSDMLGSRMAKMDRQRCTEHGLIADGSGKCSRCLREADRENARTIYRAGGALVIASLVAIAGWKLAKPQAVITTDVAAQTAQSALPAVTTPAATAQSPQNREARVKEAMREVSVVVYTADYCGWCRKTKAWLDQRGIPFTERRVDVDPTAKREMKSKFSGGGIPAIDIDGELRQGFSPEWMERTIRERAVVRAGPG